MKLPAAPTTCKSTVTLNEGDLEELMSYTLTFLRTSLSISATRLIITSVNVEIRTQNGYVFLHILAQITGLVTS
jgi:hypothetical protein